MPTSWDPPAEPPASDAPPSRMREPAPQQPVAIIAGILTAAIYYCTVGWDQDVVAPDDRDGGLPFQTFDLYEWWQVYLLFSLLVALQAAGAWLVRGGTTWLAICIVFPVCWSIDAAIDPGGSALWPVGTVLLAGGSALFFGMVWGVVSLLRPDELVTDRPETDT